MAKKTAPENAPHHGLNYVIGTAVMTGGVLKAALVPSLDQQPAYARAYAA